MTKADDLRLEADKQNALAQNYLKTLNPEKTADAHLLGVLAAVKAVVLHQSAELHDAIEQAVMTSKSKVLSRPHRMRMAAIRGDDQAMKAIEQEIIDEHERRQRGGSSPEDSSAA